MAETDGLSFKVATYNIHSCLGTDRKFAPERIAQVIAELDADLIGLQEVGLVAHRIDDGDRGGDGWVDAGTERVAAAVLGPVERQQDRDLDGAADRGEGVLERKGEVRLRVHRTLSAPDEQDERDESCGSEERTHGLPSCRG